jgi:hypothetical protein
MYSALKSVPRPANTWQRHLQIDTMKVELSLHTLICGRARKNITNIESATNTTIYFPPPFPQIYGYCPPGAHRRPEDEIIISGKTASEITDAKMRLRNLVVGVKAFVKDVAITETKLDDILLGRLEKVRKIMEMNGSYVLFNQLGRKHGVVRVQGTDILNVERTVKEVMALVNTLANTRHICKRLTTTGFSILQCHLVGARPG